MKKKLLIGGGLVALVAVIVAIAVFGKGGDYFKGAIQQIRPVEFQLSGVLNLYVEQVSPEGCEKIGLSKTCPLTNINDAVDTANSILSKDYTTVNIYVGNGVFGEGSKELSLKDKTFNLIGNNSTLRTGGINFINSGGSVSNFNFIDGGFNDTTVGFITHGNYESSFGIGSFNKSDKEIKLKLENLYFDNVSNTGSLKSNIITIKNSNENSLVTIKNSKFKNAKGKGAIIYVEGRIKSEIQNNIFDSNIAENGAIIYAEIYSTITNNLFVNSKAGNKSVIKLTGGSSTIANNTFYKNNVYLAAADKPQDNGAVIDLAGLGGTPAAVKNNIIAHSDVLTKASDFVGVAGNVLYGWKVSPEYGSGAKEMNFDCLPTFEGAGSTSDAAYYKLKSTSECGINQGWTLTEVPKDYFGTSRPQGEKYDIGFYELPATLFQFKPLIPETLTMATCGNSKVEVGETCDDGNKIDGDDCSSTCKIEISLRPIDFCGNGLLNTSTEECDDSNQTSGDGCSATCEIEEDEDEDQDEDDDDDFPTIPEEETECGEWSDVSDDDQEYDMWMDLCEKGIVKGNDDGTLRTEDKLNRAELLALAFRASEYEDVYSVNNNSSDCFTDVETQWYAKYFCTGKNKGFIEGYQDGQAKPERGVILAEGLKMFLGALDEPFDVSDEDCWYCDMVEEAGDDDYLPYSFTDPKQVGPIELTRRKAFNMLYRIMLYR